MTDLKLGEIAEDLHALAVLGKTDMRCRYCGKQLVLKNRDCNASPRARGTWEIDHSNPKGRGGSERPVNLWPLCCDCHDEKSNRGGGSAGMNHGEYKRWRFANEKGWICHAEGLRFEDWM